MMPEQTAAFRGRPVVPDLAQTRHFAISARSAEFRTNVSSLVTLP